MATKSRHLKTPIQLWVYDNRKRLNLESIDLATLTGVTEDTARGWESRGRPSEDAITALERRFGIAAPRGNQVAGDQADLVAALDRQTAAITDLIGRLDRLTERQGQGLLDLAEAVGDLARQASLAAKRAGWLPAIPPAAEG